MQISSRDFFVIFYEKYLGSENYGGVAKVGQLLTAQVLALRIATIVYYTNRFQSESILLSKGPFNVSKGKIDIKY